MENLVTFRWRLWSHMCARAHTQIHTTHKELFVEVVQIKQILNGTTYVSLQMWAIPIW